MPADLYTRSCRWPCQGRKDALDAMPRVLVQRPAWQGKRQTKLCPILRHRAISLPILSTVKVGETKRARRLGREVFASSWQEGTHLLLLHPTQRAIHA
eukprot:6119590-Amphidinium_carterae.1